MRNLKKLILNIFLMNYLKLLNHLTNWAVLALLNLTSGKKFRSIVELGYLVKKNMSLALRRCSEDNVEVYWKWVKAKIVIWCDNFQINNNKKREQKIAQTVVSIWVSSNFDKHQSNLLLSFFLLYHEFKDVINAIK